MYHFIENLLKAEIKRVDYSYDKPKDKENWVVEYGNDIFVVLERHHLQSISNDTLLISCKDLHFKISGRDDLPNFKEYIYSIEAYHEPEQIRNMDLITSILQELN